MLSTQRGENLRAIGPGTLGINHITDQLHFLRAFAASLCVVDVHDLVKIGRVDCLQALPVTSLSVVGMRMKAIWYDAQDL
jgi:hypothetical protein